MEEFFEVLEGILPKELRRPQAPGENAIEQRHVMIYGGAGSGKTNAFRHVAECLKALYGPKVHVAWTDADLEGLIAKLSPSAPVQLLCCEDMTRVRQPEPAIHAYFTIRHLMAERTGKRWGLVVTAFTTHDLFGIQPKSLRTDVDLAIFLETPSNPYDQRLAREMLGEEAYDGLRRVEGLRRERLEYKGVAAYATKWRRGLTYIPKTDFELGEERKREGEEWAGLEPFLLKVLEAVWEGAVDLRGLGGAFPTVAKEELARALAWLEDRGLVRREGWLGRRWKLTLEGANFVLAKKK